MSGLEAKAHYALILGDIAMAAAIRATILDSASAYTARLMCRGGLRTLARRYWRWSA